jgi:hypothetical protein
MGATLWTLLRGHFQDDLSAMLKYLIDAKHAHAGWSALVGKDFNLRPGYTWQKATADGAKYEVYSKRPDYRRPQSFALRPEDLYLFTEKDLEDGTHVEWLYAFDQEHRKLFVRDVSAKEDVAVIDLNGEEPNWTVIECGESFERCRHYTWHHNLLPKTSNLGTQTWLERRPLDFRDAIAVIVSGRRYKMTGSGGDAAFMRKQYPAGTWLSSVIAGNGKRLEIPTAIRTQNGYRPVPGVSWVMPATVNNGETIVEAE